MKAFVILGSIIGFLIGAGCSLAGDCSWSTAISRACIAALAAAFLTRWWSRIWMESLEDAVKQRRHPRPVETKPVKV